VSRLNTHIKHIASRNSGVCMGTLLVTGLNQGGCGMHWGNETCQKISTEDLGVNGRIILKLILVR